MFTARHFLSINGRTTLSVLLGNADVICSQNSKLVSRLHGGV